MMLNPVKTIVMKRIFLLLLAAICLITSSGCRKTEKYFIYSGPRKISYEAQTIELTAKRSDEYWISHISYQTDGDGGCEMLDSSDEDGCWKSSWFEIRREGLNIIVKVSQNSADESRRIDIDLNSDSFAPTIVTVTQLPYGQTPKE